MSEPRPPSSAAIDIVLLVDDEVIARMVISKYLRDCGYKVIEAANAAQAMQLLQQTELDIAVVLSGISNEGVAGGFALAQWLRSERPGTEIILAGNHTRAANALANYAKKDLSWRSRMIRSWFWTELSSF